jgi:hypothetical protein
MNAPRLKAKIKIQKPSAPIRPVIGNICVPTHKIAKLIRQIFKDLINLKKKNKNTNTT